MKLLPKLFILIGKIVLAKINSRYKVVIFNQSNIKSKPIHRSPWQNSYAERVIETIRQELLNHIIPFNEKHPYKLLDEYINNYYNTDRTHQGVDGNTPIPKTEFEPVDINKIKIKTTAVLNGLYHTYDRVA